MAKSKTISVTPNVKKCLEELEEAVKALPAGDLKERAQGAIRYLDRTFRGEKQPGRGQVCPPKTKIVI
ncbi:MAG: hypothetical protein ACE5LC_10585 [Candidatus Aminicenantales bacterium]